MSSAGKSAQPVATKPAAIQTRAGELGPGPRPFPVLGWRARGIGMLRDPIGHLCDLHRRYGDICAWDPSKPRHVFAFGPAWNETILSQPERFISDPFRDVPAPPGSALARLRGGLMARNGADHRRHRELMRDAFSIQRVKAYMETMVDCVERELAEWKPGQQRDLAQDMHRITLDIGVRTMFGLEKLEQIEALRAMVDRLLTQAASPLNWVIPFAWPGTPLWRSLHTAGDIEAFIVAEIERKRAQPGPQKDALACLVAARTADGDALSEEDLIGEAYTIFCQETSASALTWTLLLLDQHPEVLGALLEELDAGLGGSAPTYAALNQLTLLDGVIKESLRLLPPAFLGSRHTAEPCELGPFALEEGTAVFFSQYITHRMPELFADPLRFDPHRWAQGKPAPYAYLPFGAGAHSCIAAAFATVEMKVVLAMVLQRFRLAIPAGTRIDRIMRIALIPKGGLPMTVGSREMPIRHQAITGNIHEMVALKR